METIATILNVIGILLILVSLGLCIASNPMGILGSAVGFLVYGLGGIAYMSNEDKLTLAADILKKDGEMLITKHHQDTVSTIHVASTEIQSNIEKIHSSSAELEKKTANVSNEEAKRIFKNKQNSLTRLAGKLEGSLIKLESCAFEQIIINQLEQLSGPTGHTNVTENINEELKAVRQVMQEVEQINSL
ncbi:MAG: hypothetical protein J6J97_01270 [Akkermansia sp.]|nr:hypothetical protein [Akkermansia sp.]MBQ8376760.1 hypothetical protein [Akkermansia sp.]